MPSYPLSVKTFAARANGQQIDAAHVNELQDELMAVELDLLSIWQTRAFNAAHYSAGAGTWTVIAPNVLNFAWKKVGRTVTVTFDIQNTATSAAMGGELRIALPSGIIAARFGCGYGICNDGIWATVIADVLKDGTHIRIFKANEVLWANSQTTVIVKGTLTFEATT